MSSRLSLLAPLLLALPLTISAAADVARPSGDSVVELPPFVITETKASERPWRYAEGEGFEIISQVGDESAQQVFAALWRGPRLTLGPALRPRLSTPTAVIIFDQEPDRSGGVGSLGSVKQKHEQGSHWTNLIKRTLPDREVFCLNLSGTYFTYSSTFRFDLRTLLALHAPPAPPWLLEALYGAYGLYREGIEYPDRGKSTGLIRGLWCNEAELLRAEPLLGRANEHFLVPPEKRRGPIATSPLRETVTVLTELWNGGYPEDKRPPAEIARWAASCALLARWALYAEEGKRHDAFWRFAEAACGRVVDEALFREHFGLGFDEARDEVAWYLPIATNESANRKIEPLVVPKLKFRPASVSEVARLRGDWERGEASLLAARFPEIAAKYSAKAGRTLRLAQAADPTDHRLTEVTGLYEFETGNSARALELLTAATASGQARPRAWFTLAHLRLLDFNATNGGPKAMLSHEQALTILLPLEQSWQQQPAMAVTYELLAELWRRCPDLPAEPTLARLQEGQRTFPRVTRLTLAAFRACLERGDRAAALGLLENALPFTGDSEMRQRLEKTRDALIKGAERK